MKTIILIALLFFYLPSVFSQLSVTATATNSTICLGDSTIISASALPVTYSVSAIANDPIPSPGFQSTFLANAGSAQTILSSGTLDDGRWDNIDLPFTFRYFGVDYNSINISTNGWIGMGSTSNTSTGMGVVLPNAAAPNNVIHAITADLDFKSPAVSSLEYFYTGSFPNTKFVIRYNDIKFFGATGTANVEVILYETTNVIEIHTSDCSNISLFKAQGIENISGTVAVTVPGRNNIKVWTGAPDAYRFTPDQFTYTWSPAAGLSSSSGPVVTAHPSTNTTYTVTALNTANSQSGNTTVTVNINNSSYLLATTNPGSDVCQNKSVVPGITYFRDGNCNLIASIEPAGANPVTNSINTCVTINSAPGKLGTADFYLARKYDIQPIVNAQNATAVLTLYYLQSEFDDYNAQAAFNGITQLPSGPADVIGISNLVLRQFHGTGTNPGDYTGSSVDFTTAAPGFFVTWNSTTGWWEVTVPITGFSGFYLTTKAAISLPITLVYLKGSQAGSGHLLNWKANCLSTKATFVIENSSDGIRFSPLAKIEADKARCSLPFDYTNNNPFPGTNYYRIKVTDIDGKYNYSPVVALVSKNKNFQFLSLMPNPVRNEDPVLKIYSEKSDYIKLLIIDPIGRTIAHQNNHLIQGENRIHLNITNLSAGVYQLYGITKEGQSQILRFIKQ